MIYLKIIAIAIVLVIILRSLSAFFNILTDNRKIRMIFRRTFPVIEIIVLFFYIFWASDQLFNHLAIYNLLTGSLIVVLVGISGWYLLRDLISGIILKAGNGFEPGQRIKTSGLSGTIKKTGYLSLEIINKKGEIVIIPFSRLSRLNIRKPADTDKWVEHIVKLKISSKYPSEKIRNLLEKRVLEMPWIVSGDTNKVNISRDEAGNYIAEIHFQSLSPGMAIKTEEALQVFIREVFTQQ
jgi:small-conductance mechanosensitive channel